MKTFALLLLILAAVAPLKLKMETDIGANRDSTTHIRHAIDLRERVGQTAFIAILGGFRSVVADFLFIDGHFAWERVDWPHLLMRLRQVTMLQPQMTMFWDVAAWHMAWNAGTAALNDSSQPPLARKRLQHEYVEIGRDFLERGVANNPQNPQLYEALARLYRDKLHDHARASENFLKASRLPGCAAYDERFSAYELSYCEGHEREAYDRLRTLFQRGGKERLPTLIVRLRAMEEQLHIPPEERIRPE
ncbi:MAG TPA: hypothetical protein VGH08_09105 [Chthoniobacterales bacterium]|jgi:hypothetical protein